MNASLHDAYAADYDGQVLSYGSHVHEAMFGLCFDSILPGLRLLDIGIGTGLAAALFARAGLSVSGMDFSAAMLDICRSKSLAEMLVLQDIQQTPWPFPPSSFNYAVSCGVYHFIQELYEIFAEVNRVLQNSGWYAFTTKAPSGQAKSNVEVLTAGGMQIFTHSPQHITELLHSTGFETTKVMRCFVGDDIHQIWVARKLGIPLTSELDSP